MRASGSEDAVSRDDLLAQAREAMYGLNRVIMARGSAHWAHLDISMAQLKALFALSEAADLTVSALAERLGTKPSATSVLVDRLVHQGLVKRIEDESDRRRVLLSMTEEATALVERLRQGRSQIAELLKALNSDELRALTVGLNALVRVAEADLKASAGLCPQEDSAGS